MATKKKAAEPASAPKKKAPAKKTPAKKTTGPKKATSKKAAPEKKAPAIKITDEALKTAADELWSSVLKSNPTVEKKLSIWRKIFKRS